MLADIDVERVSGFDTVEVLKAAYRQSCHDRARFLHTLLEVGLREQFTGDSVVRLEVPDEFAPDEARAALVWSRRRADSAFDLAWNLHRRLPALGEAMLAGELDEPRASAFIRWTSGLTDTQAGWVCERLISRAPAWTVGELIEHIQRLVLAIDPDWAEKRYREAVRRRRMVGMRNDDGTATVSGLDLPLDRAVAGCERIDELARACKRAGDHRPVDHIRADLFLGSLDGSFEGLSDTEIVFHVRTHPFVDAAPSDASAGSPDIRPTDQATEPDDAAATESATESDDAAADGADAETPDEPRGARCSGTRSRTRPEATCETGGSTGAGIHGEARDGDPTQDRAESHADDHVGAPVAKADDTSDDETTDHDESAPAAQASSTQARSAQAMSAWASSMRAWSVPEIRVKLTTLLGLDEHPAQLPGWGMVHAVQARRIVASMLPGQWRFAVCADNGHLLVTGITGRRPCPPAQRPARDARRGGIVELQVTVTQLRELAAAAAATGVWAPLIADLARHAQLAEPRQPEAGRPGAHPPDATGSAESAESAGRRHAGAALRRYVQIRGRVCSWPGCRMPASRTDQDHIHAWADDGATTADNLHLACRHDHRARHLGGWRVTWAGPHLIVWTSPLGHVYPSPLPKIIQPAPEPRPRNWPAAPPGRLPADPAGAPNTIMAPYGPLANPSGGRHGTTSGEADGEGIHATREQVDDQAGGASFKHDRETPPL
ncbi:HNH endonuclease signature motif containing protein [Microbispora sp. H10830]|uniref:HNH endonuclease signature motif containing protein n=1 Tax=Microbispora sp. H10830 TaxID=2729109 RepID=UPI0016028FBF|nr:HNH endonuclease signature motif containing protein [Microbispora sp. H10830]